MSTENISSDVILQDQDYLYEIDLEVWVRAKDFNSALSLLDLLKEELLRHHSIRDVNPFLIENFSKLSEGGDKG